MISDNTGRCPECKATHHLKGDGTLGYHVDKRIRYTYGRRPACAGQGRPPTAVVGLHRGRVVETVTVAGGVL